MSLFSSIKKGIDAMLGGGKASDGGQAVGAVPGAVDQSSGATAPRSTAPGGEQAVITHRVLLIHGYSADGKEFLAWKEALAGAGMGVETIEIGNYVSLNNEISIKDLGEAFDRALRLTKWSKGTTEDTWTFDAIVHSTGMLVLRQWLVNDPFPRGDARSRVKRLKHLVGLAPATYGSPQAKKGRSWLGSLVKGNRHLGPDFMEAGDMILDGLELGSRYTWELATKDMLSATPMYDKGKDTPYVAIFIGNTAYAGVSGLANSPGTDGTVRWAGCALNSRLVQLDLRTMAKLMDKGQPTRCSISEWTLDRADTPVIAVEGRDHGTILQSPEPGAVALVKGFMTAVVDDASYAEWEARAIAYGAPALEKMNQQSAVEGGSTAAGWQQFVVHLVDDHDDGIKDYNLQLFLGSDLTQSDDPEFRPVPVIVDSYGGDSSYRCLYVRLTEDLLKLNTPGGPAGKLWIELLASSGTRYVEYEAYDGAGQVNRGNNDGPKATKLEITKLAQGSDTLFYPYTTTLVQIYLEREPTPLQAVSDLFGFLGRRS